MVHIDDDHMISLGQPQQFTAQQRSATQIERSPRLLVGQPLSYSQPLIRRQQRQVVRRQRDPPISLITCNGSPRSEGKVVLQDFVPADHLLQATFKRRDIQLSLQSQSRRHVVESALRVKLIDEPQPLLGK